VDVSDDVMAAVKAVVKAHVGTTDMEIRFVEPDVRTDESIAFSVKGFDAGGEEVNAQVRIMWRDV